MRACGGGDHVGVFSLIRIIRVEFCCPKSKLGIKDYIRPGRHTVGSGLVTEIQGCPWMSVGA